MTIGQMLNDIWKENEDWVLGFGHTDYLMYIDDQEVHLNDKTLEIAYGKTIEETVRTVWERYYGNENKNV